MKDQQRKRDSKYYGQRPTKSPSWRIQRTHPVGLSAVLYSGLSVQTIRSGRGITLLRNKSKPNPSFARRLKVDEAIIKDNLHATAIMIPDLSVALDSTNLTCLTPGDTSLPYIPFGSLLLSIKQFTVACSSIHVVNALAQGTRVSSQRHTVPMKKVAHTVGPIVNL